MSQIFESLRTRVGNEMRVPTTEVRVEVENEMKVFLEFQFLDRDESLAEV